MSNDPNHILFDSLSEYIVALDRLCSIAQKTLNVFEKDFEHIGFDSKARFEILRHFLLASRTNRLNLLVQDPHYLTRYCPRMMELLRQFSHNMAIHQTPANLQHISDPFAVADHTHYVRRFHFDDTRGVLGNNDPEEARRLDARFEEMWAVSRPCASGSPIGL